MENAGKTKTLIVDEYTTPILATAHEQTSVDSLIKLMSDEKIRHIPILDKESKVKGIISERDTKVFSLNSAWAAKVNAGDIMVESPYTVTSGTPLESVVFEMSKNKLGSALVVDSDGELQGIFTSTDALNALIEVLRKTNQ